MADTTYSVKISEEDQERLKALVNESGFSNKDFLIHLLSIYELQKAMETTPILTADIKELETLTHRINAIFVNISERIATLQHDSAEQLKQARETSAGTIGVLQQRIKDLEQERAETETRVQASITEQAQAEQQTASLRQRVKELEAAANDKQALIEEYKNKLDTQMSIVSEYRQTSEAARAIQEKNAELTAAINDQQARLDTLGIERERAISALGIEQDRAINALERKHTQEIQTLQAEHSKKLNELQNEYSKKLNEYENKVSSLLEQGASTRKNSRKEQTKEASAGRAPGTGTAKN